MDNRAWGKHQRLDLIAEPGACSVWHERALGHLCRGRPDIHKLLIWAERHTLESLEAGPASAAAGMGIDGVEIVD